MQDPEDQNAPILSPVNWIRDPAPLTYTDIKTINNLRDPTAMNPDYAGTQTCSVSKDPVIPASMSTDTEGRNLLPSKLYNAVLYSTYKKNKDAELSRRVVHSFSFLTSRYSDLIQQVSNYQVFNLDFDLLN